MRKITLIKCSKAVRMHFIIPSFKSLPFLFWRIMPEKAPVFLILRQNTAFLYYRYTSHQNAFCFSQGSKWNSKKQPKIKKAPAHNYIALGSHLLSRPFVKLTPAHRCTSWTSWSPGRICFSLHLGWYPADKCEALTYIKRHKKAQWSSFS